MNRRHRVLIAGIGNIFCGDDGFGVEVARRLCEERLPDGVDVADFGIRGVHLAYELADGIYDRVILVDAVPRGEAPGTLYVIEPDVAGAAADAEAPDAHSLTPAAVLAWLRRIGGRCEQITIVGCEPASLEESMSLSEPVAAAVEGAMEIVRNLLDAWGQPRAFGSGPNACRAPGRAQ